MLLTAAIGLVLAGLALVVGLLAAGCGSDGETSEGTAASTDSTHRRRPPDFIDWPLFGRVPERTHYLPTERGALDPPLREAWSINTHGLIEFPPAVADGVAYVVNKFGNLRGGHAARPQDSLGARSATRRTAASRPTSPRPSTTKAGSTSPSSTANCWRSTRRAARPDLEAQPPAHLESSPLAVDGTPLHRHRQEGAGRAAMPPTAR